MPIIQSLLDEGRGASTSSQATASISPTANALILVSVASNLGSSTNTPTLTGAGMTWVEIRNQSVDSGKKRITVFRGLSGAPGSGALTIDFAGQAQDRVFWSISKFTGVKTTGTSGADAIIQSLGAFVSNGGNTTGITVDLATPTNSANATYGAFTSDSTPGVSAGSGFSIITNSSGAGGVISTESAINVEPVNFTWSSQAINGAEVALEIAADQGSGMLTNFYI